MHPSEIAARFDAGDNITSVLKAASGSYENTEEIIETAYDLQAGSYIEALDRPGVRRHKLSYAGQIACELERLGPVSSLLEPGVGEATTLGLVIRALKETPAHIHGFDLSWSRVKKAREWLDSRGQSDVQLSVASLMCIPFADNSFDVVYTAHTVEPNGGREREALAELYRVASRYLVLLEPSWSMADGDGRARMERLGYVRHLEVHAKALGMQVIRHERFPYTPNPRNPTALTIIAKQPDAVPAVPQFVCPRFGNPVYDCGDVLYSPESMRAYPRFGGIPCLRTELGIIASALSR